VAVAERLPEARALRTLDLQLNDLTTGAVRLLLEAVAKVDIQALTLDKNDLRVRDPKGGTDDPWKEFAAANALLSLSASHANLGSSVPDIAESLAARKFGLAKLDLSGTVFAPAAMTTLAPQLHKVQHCNLSKCRLRDAAGAAIADLGMVGNETLTFLSLRDNSLKETAGLALEDALRKNRKLRALQLELNAMDHRSLLSIQHLLARNEAVFRQGQPDVLRAQIEDLKQKQVRLADLQEGQKSLLQRKATSIAAVEAAEEKLAQVEEAAESGKAEMDARAEDIRVELIELEETLRARQAEKRDLEINQEKEEKVIKAQMSKIQGAVWKARKEAERMQARTRQLEEDFVEQTKQLEAELEDKTQKRQAAEQLAQAAQRNLDVFITSLEAVKPEENDPLVQSAGAGAKDKRGTVTAKDVKPKRPSVKKR
jgi:hypothetical protein